MIYTLRFDHASLALVAEGLKMLPYGQVAGLVNNIQTEITAQERAAKEAAATAEADAAVARAADGVVADAKAQVVDGAGKIDVKAGDGNKLGDIGHGPRGRKRHRLV